MHSSNQALGTARSLSAARPKNPRLAVAFDAAILDRPMAHLLRLDLDRIRQNLQEATGSPQTEEDVLRALAARGAGATRRLVGATEQALGRFGDAEIVERKPGQLGFGGVPVPQ